MEDVILIGQSRTVFCATLLCASLITPTLPTLAATVFRCEDANGKITYTLQGCPTDQSLQLQDAHNPTPGSGTPTPLAQVAKSSRTGKAAKTGRNGELVVVAEHQDGCGNRVTGSTRRQAMIRKEVRAGMTRTDVESTLGKPDKVSSQNGQLRYQYGGKQGRSQQVSFDENGCVRGKR
ncbi:DUF4124 domain-containing protein [Pseudomonas cavernae]|uniref:DUF4124 domain-containing protein n=1 Tax=Pseudomonas cavernae TaxID=2320867 RepID=A0A385YZV5_9PSED|nr:DUF4124 domain-containing protein [Pseudomonas cavernae]